MLTAVNDLLEVFSWHFSSEMRLALVARPSHSSVISFIMPCKLLSASRDTHARAHGGLRQK